MKLRFRKIKFPDHGLKAKYQAEPELKSELSTFHKGSLLSPMLLCEKKQWIKLTL